MKIVIDNKIPGLAEGLKATMPYAEILQLEGTCISPDDIADAEVLMVRTRTCCNADLLEGSRVKLLGTATIGTDHIDTAWCEANGIKVVNAPGCNAPAVMQYVGASLFNAGFDPSIHTLGVVGKGHIGSLVVELYRNAGCNVVVCDPPRQEAGLADEDYLSLQRLLEACDAVTFHVPYTRKGPHPTHHLLAGKLPERPKIFVNASRGPVVDPEVLLAQGKQKIFIIDTWPFEEFPQDFDEETRRRLIESAYISTPHIAGYSIEGKQRATKAMLSALHAYIGDVRDSGTNNVGRYNVPPLKNVIESFDPTSLSAALKASPSSFESLRATHLRHEAKS